MNERQEQVRYQANVGRVRGLMEAGYTVAEISDKLGLDEATVSEYRAIVDEALEIKNRNND